VKSPADQPLTGEPPEEQPKKRYIAPRLIVHGSVEAITKGSASGTTDTLGLTAKGALETAI